MHTKYALVNVCIICIHSRILEYAINRGETRIYVLTVSPGDIIVSKDVTTHNQLKDSSRST